MHLERLSPRGKSCETQEKRGQPEPIKHFATTIRLLPDLLTCKTLKTLLASPNTVLLLTARSTAVLWHENRGFAKSVCCDRAK